MTARVEKLSMQLTFGDAERLGKLMQTWRDLDRQDATTDDLLIGEIHAPLDA
jgi:hypothetical protein